MSESYTTGVDSNCKVAYIQLTSYSLHVPINPPMNITRQMLTASRGERENAYTGWLEFLKKAASLSLRQLNVRSTWMNLMILQRSGV